ncbi:MAG: hypothetical protein ACTSUU_04925, partial [Candidatus Thorarchaeota archaeon]
MIDREKLAIDPDRLQEINEFLMSEDNPLTTAILDLIEKYGGVEEINRKAREARQLDNLMAILEKKKSPYVDDLTWLQERRDDDAFITIRDYRRKVLGDRADSMTFDDSFAVTLEISA